MSAIATFHPGPHLSECLTPAINDAGRTLRVTVERSGSGVLLRVGGEVDASSEVTWKRLLGEVAAATAAPGPLVVDTNGLDFMGCAAFTVLAEQSAQCRRRGIELCLVSNQPIVARIIAAGRLEAELSFYRNVDAALDA